jgi:hypothetical protein
MREYQTTGIIRINSGYIGLDRRQADARRSRVTPTQTDGVYQVLDQIEFKAGEKIRLDNPDKVLLDRMQDLTPPDPADEAAPAKKAAPKPAAKPRKGTRKK